MTSEDQRKEAGTSDMAATTETKSGSERGGHEIGRGDELHVIHFFAIPKGGGLDKAGHTVASHVLANVLRTLAMFTGRGGGVFPSQKLLVELTALGDRTVDRALCVLQGWNLIWRAGEAEAPLPGQFGTVGWEINWPEFARYVVPSKRGKLPAPWKVGRCVHTTRPCAPGARGDSDDCHAPRGRCRAPRGQKPCAPGSEAMRPGDICSKEENRKENREENREGVREAAARPAPVAIEAMTLVGDAGEGGEAITLPASVATVPVVGLWRRLLDRRAGLPTEERGPLPDRLVGAIVEAMEAAGAEETARWLRRCIDDGGRVESLPGGPTTASGEVNIPHALGRDERFMAVWRDWESHLAAKRAPLTPIAARRQLRRLWRELGGDIDAAIRCVESSIANNWRGLFPEHIAPSAIQAGGESARIEAELERGRAERERRRAAV